MKKGPYRLASQTTRPNAVGFLFLGPLKVYGILTQPNIVNSIRRQNSSYCGQHLAQQVVKHCPRIIVSTIKLEIKKSVAFLTSRLQLKSILQLYLE